ncbi:glycosyltransferase family 4 protein [Paenibacillus mendelii]|uniref:Glycosyltransferase family 4 protein n=1 Tax=Paenibacillus mendelii TaxID=206163 RepID=A0ABV6JA08_9BACL|nr:glycosyltransferase [Paenibacillus mendelii]MCQ6559715.1 glycosyltransferase [Paenibacillus mendelii]
MKRLVKKEGASAINRMYGVISAMGLEIASKLLKWGVRVDSSQVGSYNFFSRNVDSYREWCDRPDIDKSFVKNVIGRIEKLGAFNPRLVKVLKEIAPDQDVRYIRPFVETSLFKPDKKQRMEREKTFTIGWAGNKGRKSKNYKTLYLPIVKAYKKHPYVKFAESTVGQRTVNDMPAFYNKLDLLLVTSANEGAPNPALEAYSCGIPVLSTNVGYIKTVAHEKARSLILDTDQPKHFIEKIDYLVKNRDAYLEIKKGCRRNIRHNWTVEKAMDDWLRILFNIKGDKE